MTLEHRQRHRACVQHPGMERGEIEFRPLLFLHPLAQLVELARAEFVRQRLPVVIGGIPQRLGIDLQIRFERVGAHVGDGLFARPAEHVHARVDHEARGQEQIHREPSGARIGIAVHAHLPARSDAYSAQPSVNAVKPAVRRRESACRSRAAARSGSDARAQLVVDRRLGHQDRALLRLERVEHVVAGRSRRHTAAGNSRRSWTARARGRDGARHTGPSGRSGKNSRTCGSMRASPSSFDRRCRRDEALNRRSFRR